MNRKVIATLALASVATLALTGAGFLTNGLNILPTFQGFEQFPVDSLKASGANPQSGSVNLMQIATESNFLTMKLDKTTVAGTRYYTGYPIQAPFQALTGIQVLIGGTGGTDTWTVELHDPTGAQVAQSAATTAGTANLWQQFPFVVGSTATPYTPTVAGTYYLTVISNGNTAKPSTYDAPALSAQTLVTGSQAGGTEGTAAAITTPAKTYTANLGPIAIPYQ